MGTKTTWSVVLLGASVLAVLVGVWAITPIVARAQCGTIESSCYACHAKTNAGGSVAEWHTTFGHRYACWSCHGGNDTAPDKDQAHVGMVLNPLDDAYTNCYFCHPADYQQRAQQLTQMLGTEMK
jgi:hypothetical protein